MRGVQASRLVVTVEPAFAQRWLIQRLGNFSALYPNIELEIDNTPEVRTLGQGADIAIRYIANPRGRRLSGRRLLKTDGVPVAARGLVPRSDVAADAKVVGTRLLHDDNGDAWRGWFKAAGLQGFDAARHSFLSDWGLAISAAVQGQGVALVASVFIDRELRTGQLVPLGTTRTSFGEYWLLESKDRATAPIREAFRRWIEKELAHGA